MSKVNVPKKLAEVMNSETVFAPGGAISKSNVIAVGPGQAVEGGAAGQYSVVTAKTNTKIDGTPAKATELVVAPGGYRLSSLVYNIEPGAIVDGSGNHFTKVDQTGKMLLDMGKLDMTTKVASLPLMPVNVTRQPGPVPGLGTGWIVYASWTENAKPLTMFTTTWVVPPPPATQSGQLIYLFSGVQNSSMIYQPVLQWGSSPAGGGNYWAVASWYVDGQGGQAFHGPLVQVNVGQVLTGVITETGSSSAGFSYNCQFAGIPHSNLPIQNVQQLTWCIETLECYGLQHCSDYPNTCGTAMAGIEIEAGGSPVTPSWSPTNFVTDCGQHAVVISDSSPGGAVDLYYNRTPGLIGQITLSETSTNTPALASLNGSIYLAWTGVGNGELNVNCSANNGLTFGGKATSSDTSAQAPALCAQGGKLYLAWTGVSNDELNVCQVNITSSSATGFSNKVTISNETSPFAPSLASLNGNLYLAWAGTGNNELNIAVSLNNGATFVNKYTSGQTTKASPTLAVQNGTLFIAWKGDGNDNMNVGQVILSGNNITGIAHVVTLPDTTQNTPALTSNGNLFLAWKGDGNTNLNVESSTNSGASFGNKFESTQTSNAAPALGSLGGTIYLAWTGVGNDELNIARVSR